MSQKNSPVGKNSGKKRQRLKSPKPAPWKDNNPEEEEKRQKELKKKKKEKEEKETLDDEKKNGPTVLRKNLTFLYKIFLFISAILLLTFLILLALGYIKFEKKVISKI